jgi:hypothetical protein
LTSDTALTALIVVTIATSSHLSHLRPPRGVRLQTVPGIGPIVALIILAEARDLRRFGCVSQFLKYCGLDLCTEQSGQSRGTTHLSKRGNVRLRYAFWMAGTVAIRTRQNSFRRKFDAYMRPDPAFQHTSSSFGADAPATPSSKPWLTLVGSTGGGFPSGMRQHHPTHASGCRVTFVGGGCKPAIRCRKVRGATKDLLMAIERRRPERAVSRPAFVNGIRGDD